VSKVRAVKVWLYKGSYGLRVKVIGGWFLSGVIRVRMYNVSNITRVIIIIINNIDHSENGQPQSI
jgi:hypothetical protein